MQGTLTSSLDGDDQAALTATLPAADLAHFAAAVEEMDAAGSAALGGGNDYCVTCQAAEPNYGQRHTVHAGNGVFAFAKALKICGAGFSITQGHC